MVTDIITQAEVELGKRLDLRTMRVTRTDRSLVVLARGRRGSQFVERCLLVRHDGRWEITGCPQPGESAKLIANDAPVLGGGGLHPRDLRRIVATMCVKTTGETA